MVVVASGCEEANVQMPLGLWNSFNIQMMFGSEISPSNIRVLSQGIPPPCTQLLHFACPNSFNGCRKLSIFLCPASNIIKAGTNPHLVMLHIHLLHFSHLPYPLLPISMLSRRNLLSGCLCLEQTIKFCFPEKYKITKSHSHMPAAALHRLQAQCSSTRQCCM